MAEGLQAALPREMYVDPQAWSAERDAVLFGEWYCLGRLDDLGLAGPAKVLSVDVAGESVLVTSDEEARLHAAYNVCRHRGSQLRPPAQAACDAAALRCPYHSWTYGLDGRLLKSPHAEVGDPARVRAAPGGRGHVGRVRLRQPHATAGETPRRAGRRAAATTLANYGLDALVTGTTLRYEVAANYKVLLENYNECYHCGPVHPELSRLVPAFAGGGSDLDWDNGIPHREGAWTFTMSGTTTRACLPGLDEHERTRHKGDLVYPNLMVSASADHVAAFVLEPRAVDRTDVTCLLLFDRDEAAARASTRATRSSCGTWSTGRTGRSASRCSAGCRRAPTGTGGSRRWRTRASTSGGGCCLCWGAADA